MFLDNELMQLTERRIAGPLRYCLLLGAVGACGDSEVTPPTSERTPAAVVALAGDGQLHFPGTVLPIVLIAGVVDGNGEPAGVGGLQTTWTVVEGGGSIEADADTTSRLGHAFASWTVGPAVGANTVQLVVGDLAPVTFTAETANPGPIVFVSNARSRRRGDDVEGFPADLYVMNEDGSSVIPLISPDTRIIDYLADPVWFPDGTRVLFARSDPRPAGGIPGAVPLGVFSVLPNGTVERQVPPGGLPEIVQFFQEPAWRPAGFLIAGHVPIDDRVYTMTQTGSVARPLTPPGVVARSPSWSPHTEEIAFSCAAGGQTDICVIGEDGEGFRKITDDQPEDGEPVWSPDGSKILFSRDSLLGGGIWLMNADGSGQEQLFPGFATSPAWSPDGTKFLMTVTETNQSDIYIFDVATAEATNLTESRYWERQAAWRP
jgi:hypothetical protein